MAATYTPGGSGLIDRVRLLVGDTVVARARLQDEEITALAGDRTNAAAVAADCADAIAAGQADAVDTSIDGASVAASQAVKHWRDLAARLRVTARLGGGITGVAVSAPVIATGTSREAMQKVAGDPDRAASAVNEGRDRFSNPPAYQRLMSRGPWAGCWISTVRRSRSAAHRWAPTTRQQGRPHQGHRRQSRPAHSSKRSDRRRSTARGSWQVTHGRRWRRPRQCRNRATRS